MKFGGANMNNVEHQSNLHIVLLLRLMEVPPTDLNAIIQGYKQICEIEENHTTTMLSLARQQHGSTSDIVPPPAKRPCHTPTPPSPHVSECQSSARSILDRSSNALYHGMSNLTARIFHHMLARGEPKVECEDVARGVLDWLHKTDHTHKKTKFVVRPCNRRTGNLCMVYTRLPADDPVHSVITGWILDKMKQETTGSTKPRVDDDTPQHHLASSPDVFAFDPWTVWSRFQKVFPVMAIYKSQWVSTSDIAHTASLMTHLSLVSPEELHAGLHWPSEIDTRWVIKLASRLYNDQPWARWLVPIDQDTTHCHIDSIGCLRRAACVLHGFLLGPKGSCANIWEAIIMPNRSMTVG